MGRTRYKEDIFTEEDLFNFLLGEGYTIEKRSNCHNIFGKGIYGYLITELYIEDMPMLIIDRNKCYDKATRCPLKVHFPMSSNFLKERLEFIGNKENNLNDLEEYFRHPKQ